MVCSLVALATTVSLWSDTTLVIAGVPMALTAPLALIVFAAVPGLLSYRALRPWLPLALVLALPAVGLAVVWVAAGRSLGYLAAIAFAALGEELAFSVAWVVMAGALAARLARVPWQRASRWPSGVQAAAVLASATAFALLPGHIDQARSLAGLLPFFALGLALSFVCLRTGSVLSALAVHVLLDWSSVTTHAGLVSPAINALVVALALGSLLVVGDHVSRMAASRAPAPSSR